MTARPPRRRWVGLLLGLALCSAAASASEAPPVEPSDALRQGNRAFRQGRMEEALELYTAGYRPGHKLLAYNAGTTAHHLDRLPLALLWYRRAALDGDDDPWLRSHRELARQYLGAPRHPPPAPWPTLLPWAPWLAWVGFGLAWAAVAVARRRIGFPRLPEVLLTLAALLLVASWWLPRQGPRPLVLLAPCDDTGGVLAAGAEVWGRSAADPTAGYEVFTPDGPLRCPGAAVGEVHVLASFE